MDIPLAIQTYLAADPGVQAAVRSTSPTGGPMVWPACSPNGVFLLELDETIDPLMPIECVVIRGSGGPGGFGTLQLNDQRLAIACYGGTPHLSWNLDGAVYAALKKLGPSVWAQTYLHWAHATVRGSSIIEPTMQWPITISAWQVRASDLTIAA